MMLNLKGAKPIQWWSPLQRMIKTVGVSKKARWRHLMLFSACLLGNLLLTPIVLANYAAMIQNPNDGYLIKLESNSSITADPVAGSDGKNYYRVGSPIVITSNSSALVSVTGTVKCIGRTWGSSSTDISANNSYHRLFIYAPAAGTTVEGKKAYRVNSNIIMTIDSKMLDWINIPGAAICSNGSLLLQPASYFYSQFPITVTFYINDRIIDGQVVIPALPLGGYVRAFMEPSAAPTYNTWPLGETSVPMRLLASTLNLTSSCTTMTSTGQASTVNLRHGQLNALNYNSTVTEKVTYTCQFSTSTKVRLHLDYATDSDPQKRLPMVNSQNSDNKIYSELTMTDEATGQTGKDFKIDIKDLKTIKINSHVQGTNAVAGDYNGSAWLTATFD